jgi:hypothetical protein
MTRISSSREVFMQQVAAVPPMPTYAAGLAEVVTYDLLWAPSPILASANFWNTFAALAQRVPDPAQLNEFLSRLRARLLGTSAAPQAGQPRFSGQRATSMLQAVAAVRRQPQTHADSPPFPQGPHAHLIAQVDLAAQMVAAMGG